MKNTKIKHHLMKQVVSREELLQLGWGVKLYFSKSLGNSQMTDPIKGQFNDHYRRLIKINNYPYKYEAINSLSLSLCFAKEEKSEFFFGKVFVFSTVCTLETNYLPVFPGHK